MKYVNLFKSNLEGKQLRSEKSLTKKATAAALSDFEKSLDAELTKVIKAEDRRARNVGNAAKGQYKTAIQLVVNCFPYQTASGLLCRRHTLEDGTKVWAEKKLTAAAARGIIRDSLKNFTENVGKPVVTRVAIGEVIEK